MSIDLKALQREELDILQVILKTLGKHGIEPFLIAGSCIGAVRHQGFIPWDDDIDIGLLREDYDKAKDILLRELPDGYSYCDWKLEKDYPCNFAKVRKNNTSFVQYDDMHLNINHGIFVDIFPYDFVSSNAGIFRCQAFLAKILRSIINSSCASNRREGLLRPLWQRIILSVGHHCIHMKFFQWLLDKTSQCHNGRVKAKEQSMICNFMVTSPWKEYIPYTSFGKGTKITFEGIPCLVPEDYDRHLSQIYGKYMELPPPEKRHPVHDPFYFSTTESYKMTEQKH